VRADSAPLRLCVSAIPWFWVTTTATA